MNTALLQIMAQNSCTALIRYTPLNIYFPHQPRNSPPTTFYSLPREIRDKIYGIALVSPSAITVWKGEMKLSYLPPPLEGPHPRPTSRVRWREINEEVTRASLRTLSLNLLFCNKTLGYEAAAIFYGKNTFSFEGDHNWDPIVSWLKTIGDKNRNSLKSLKVDAKRPDQVWQNSRGERVRHPGGSMMEDIYPRHPYLNTRGGAFKYGFVDNINPALEDMFLLLGQRTSKQRVTITMQLAHIYPGGGTNPDPMEQLPECNWYSMELPNLVDKFLDIYTRGSELKDFVEVLWKGRYSRQLLLDEQEIIKNVGWVLTISPIEEDEESFWPGSTYKVPGGVTKYVLRRQRITGVLMAQDPSPYSHTAVYRSMDRYHYL
ncbi:hypothetical protein BGZ60DRAFT_405479 [Tricladium varicosporioides]|nr:hypothetical protein BGZ60DRAFT_405479 [Hymenoscyphus varicosporioides]